jgi:hypothetical protein
MVVSGQKNQLLCKGASSRKSSSVTVIHISIIHKEQGSSWCTVIPKYLYDTHESHLALSRSRAGSVLRRIYLWQWQRKETTMDTIGKDIFVEGTE